MFESSITRILVFIFVVRSYTATVTEEWTKTEIFLSFFYVFFPQFLFLFSLMALPAVQLLCLEQGNHLLEQHTSNFVRLACPTNFPA